MIASRPIAVIEPGDTIVTDTAVVKFVRHNRHSVTVRTPFGTEQDIAFTDLVCRPVVDGKVAAHLRALEPAWSCLSGPAKAKALFWQAVVCEVLFGYRSGHARFAGLGEPLDVFADPDASLWAKCVRMAELLQSDAERDREKVRRFYDGEVKRLSVTPQTVQNMVNRYLNDGGLLGLVDKRATRKISFERLDPRLIGLVDEVLAIFDGDVSAVSQKELLRRVLLLRKDRDLIDLKVPQRQIREFISERIRHTGTKPRQHKSARKRQKLGGYASTPAVHPGHLSMDMTVLDVMVVDPATGKAYTAEVIIVLSVATRVCVALRVVPKSARAFEAGLALYDAMRDMGMELAQSIDGVTVEDWRWTYPVSLDFSQVPVRRSKNVIIPPGMSLADVVLHKPGVRPVLLRTDNGAIFTSAEFLALLDSMGIHHSPSRVRTPTDNSATERLNETISRAVQELLEQGYKGRNPTERGSKVGTDSDKLLTAEELELHLRKWIAIDYHRVAHEGLHLPGDPHTPVSPLAMWDALMEVTGAVAVPFQADLIYTFLPILKLTVRHDGVEHRNLTYDSQVLDEFREIRTGQVIRGGQKMAFQHDPRDPSKLYFRHPDTDRIHVIPWRQAHTLEVPMTTWIVKRAREVLRDQGGPSVVRPDAVMRQTINELGSISRTNTAPGSASRQAYAARLRLSQSQRDHAEVSAAQAFVDRADGVVSLPGSPALLSYESESADDGASSAPTSGAIKVSKSIPGRDWFNLQSGQS